MPDPKITFWEEILQGFLKAFAWFFYISMGVLAKLAFDSRVQILSKREIIVKSFLSIFAGYIAAVICEMTGRSSWIKVVSPVATLLGEGIVVYVMSNWKEWGEKLLPGWFNVHKKNKK